MISNQHLAEHSGEEQMQGLFGTYPYPSKLPTTDMLAARLYSDICAQIVMDKLCNPDHPDYSNTV